MSKEEGMKKDNGELLKEFSSEQIEKLDAVVEK